MIVPKVQTPVPVDYFESIDNEQQASQGQPERPIETTPLLQSHLDRASLTFVRAFEDDPLFRYNLTVERYPKQWKDGIQRTIFYLLATDWLKTKICLTVDAGVSVTVASQPKSVVGEPPKTLIGAVLHHFVKFVQHGQSEEARKRGKEWQEKYKKAMDDTIAHKVDEMMYLDLAETDPEYQGRGYAGALLESTVMLADLQQREMHLVSSNIKNEGFYNSHGFFTVAEILMGDDNPTWHEPPVKVHIMVREPKPLLSNASLNIERAELYKSEQAVKLDSESITSTLNNPRETPVTVSPLLEADCLMASKTFVDAFDGNQLMRYLRQKNYHPEPWRKAALRFLKYLATLTYARNGDMVCLTVDKGAAFVVAALPKNVVGEPHKTLLDSIASWFAKVINRPSSEEEIKRTEEWEQKLQETEQASIANRKDDMIYLQLLATDPQCQGRGYGGALVDRITAMADSQQRATFLHSSDPANTGFYERHGFQTVGKTVVGENNPTWPHSPVVVLLMVREPRPLVIFGKEAF